MSPAASPMRATRSTGSHLMDKIVGNEFRRASRRGRGARTQGRPVNQSRKLGPRRRRRGRCGRSTLEEIRLRRAELTRGVPVPEPPFWGAAHDRAACRSKAVVPYLNERMLYQFQWGYRKDGRSLAEYKEWAQGRVAPDPARASSTSRSARTSSCRRRPTAIGHAPPQGNDVILFDTDGTARARALRVPAPEQGRRALHRRFLPRRHRQSSAT